MLVENPPQLAHELVDILELPVDAGEPHICDGVQPGGAAPSPFRRSPGAAISRSPEACRICSISSAIPSRDEWRHRALLAGARQPGQDLAAIVRLAAFVLLDHHEGDLVDALVGGEAAGAAEALAPPPYDLAVLAPRASRRPCLRRCAQNGALFMPRPASGRIGGGADAGTAGASSTCASDRTSAGRTPSFHIRKRPMTIGGRMAAACRRHGDRPGDSDRNAPDVGQRDLAEVLVRSASAAGSALKCRPSAPPSGERCRKA